MRTVGGWAHMMAQTITVAPVVTRDAYGKATYSTSPTTYQCRLVAKRRFGIAANGQQVISEWTAYVNTNAAIAPDSRITFSTADVGSTEPHMTSPPIKAVSRYSDDAGWHHTQLFI